MYYTLKKVYIVVMDTYILLSVLIHLIRKDKINHKMLKVERNVKGRRRVN